MSHAVNPSPAPKGASKNVPDGVAKLILGFVLGAGVMFLGMHFYGPREYIRVPLPAGNPPGEGERLSMPGGVPGAPPTGGGAGSGESPTPGE